MQKKQRALKDALALISGSPDLGHTDFKSLIEAQIALIVAVRYELSTADARQVATEAANTELIAQKKRRSKK